MSGHKRQSAGATGPQTWSTPAALVRVLEDRYTRDGFDLDAAAHADNAVAEHWLGPGSSISEDALAVPWRLTPVHGPVSVFANPPWNRVGEWVAHALAEVQAGHCEVVVLVLPTRAETAWWRALECPPEGVISQRDMIRGRVAYVDPLVCEQPPPNVLVSVEDLADGQAPPPRKGRSAPAEGTTVWVLRPELDARMFKGST